MIMHNHNEYDVRRVTVVHKYLNGGTGPSGVKKSARNHRPKFAFSQSFSVVGFDTGTQGSLDSSSEAVQSTSGRWAPC